MDDRKRYLDALIFMERVDLQKDQDRRSAEAFIKSQEIIKEYGRNGHTDFIIQKSNQLLAEEFRREEEALAEKHEDYETDYEKHGRLPAKAKAPEYEKVEKDQRAERDNLMDTYYKDMAVIARKQNLTQREAVDFINTYRETFKQMADRHYSQLLDHPQNPHYKNTLQKTKDASQKLRFDGKPYQYINVDAVNAAMQKQQRPKVVDPQLDADFQKAQDAVRQVMEQQRQQRQQQMVQPAAQPATQARSSQQTTEDAMEKLIQKRKQQMGQHMQNGQDLSQ